jgi:GNAT superfamily N-acetyltransferase
VRRAVPGDGDTILALVEGLARYEKLTPPDPAARQRLLRDMFWERPRIEAFLGEYRGKAVGYAFVLETYSSFLALPTLYLEDIFVLPEYRRKRVGLALFLTLAGEAYQRGCGRMEWAVLDWNRLAINFYHRLGAAQLKEWLLFRLTRQQLAEISHCR